MLVVFGIRQFVRQAILPDGAGFELEFGVAFGIRIERPFFGKGFDRLPLFIVAHCKEPRLALTRHRLIGQRVCREARCDRVSFAVMAAVDPGEYLERLPGHEHFAGADNRTP